MRNLCTIQKIKSLEPIEGKDKIVFAAFENSGFKVIVGKADFKVGDLCVYCEYDTLLPGKPEFEFLRKRCWSDKWQGHRITAMKMAGKVSEGIAFPMSILPDRDPRYGAHPIAEGFDVTDIIGARKYDPELLEEQRVVGEEKHGWLMQKLLKNKKFRDWYYPKSSKSWPSYIKKSDETRVQSLSYLFNPEKNYEGESFYVTEKVDGKSTTYAIRRRSFGRYEFVVCSRNNSYKRPKTNPNDHWKYALDNDVFKKMKAMRKRFGRDFYLQGELLGPGIQGNKYKLSELKFMVYAMYDIEGRMYYPYLPARLLVDACGFEWVPEVDITSWKWKNVDELVEYAHGKSQLNPDQDREGVVIRTCIPQEAETKMANQWSFKVINDQFLIKHSL